MELLEANPQYAYIHYPDGRETTVSIRQIAPPGDIGNGHYSTPEIIDHAIPPNTSSEKNISAENITTEATGPNSIPIKVLKTIKELISISLSTSTNESFAKRTIPKVCFYPPSIWL